MSHIAAATQVLAMVLLGALSGRVYFWLLHWSIDLFTGARSPLRVAGLTLARIAFAVSAFTWMARLGAMPLAGGFIGFLLARQLALRSARRTV